jgi:hypothetical protein
MSSHPTLDYDKSLPRASGGLFGAWTVTLPDGTGCTAGLQAVAEWWRSKGVSDKEVVWTKAARNARLAALPKLPRWRTGR